MKFPELLPSDPDYIPKDKMDDFLKVSAAVKTIRDKRLYRGDFPSFDAYCIARMGLHEDMVNQFIAFAEVEWAARKLKPGLQ